MPKYTLVDWYGNRQTFDRDTIYAEGEDGGLVPFTQGAGNPVIEPLNVTQNGVYTTPAGVNGFSPVSVNVPDLPPVLQSKEATQNGEYTPDSGYDGLSKVTVNVPAPEIKLQEKTITENGEYTADSDFDGLGKVTVEVAGSGGGSLPAGVYWEQLAGNKPYNYQNKFFLFNDELYLLTSTASNASADYAVRKILKFSGGEYVEICTFTDAYISGNIYTAIVVFKGLVHFIGGDNKRHLTWNGGASVASKGNLPVNVSSAVAFDGKLYAYAAKEGLYVWDEDSDTWTSCISSFPSGIPGIQYTYCDLFVFENELYAVNSSYLYKYTDNNLAVITSLSKRKQSNGCPVIGTKLYFSPDSSGVCAVYTYDMADGTISQLMARTPYIDTYNVWLELNGKLMISGGNNTQKTAIIMHEVTE